jgi:hypothetical protein
MPKPIYRLHAKDDGLWLELNSQDRLLSALIRVGHFNPESTEHYDTSAGIVDSCVRAVWDSLRKPENLGAR